MFFRFGAAIVLVVLVSLAGIALEKENLELRRTISRQSYRLDVLHDVQARLRVRTQELGAPVRIIEPIERGILKPKSPADSSTAQGRDARRRD
jgi:hypothetical protein